MRFLEIKFISEKLIITPENEELQIYTLLLIDAKPSKSRFIGLTQYRRERPRECSRLCQVTTSVPHILSSAAISNT